MHASDLYGRYYKDHDPKRYDQRDADGTALAMDMLKIEFGLSFEQELEEWLLRMMDAVRVRMAGRLLGERPGEFEAPHADDCSLLTDGVAYGPDQPCPECAAGTLFSPDYLFDTDVALILGEFKLSWYSMKDAPFDKKFDKWITQIKLYCYWLGITKARLYVFFVNADYKPPKPALRCWDISFTRRELVDEHSAVVRHARKKGLLQAA